MIIYLCIKFQFNTQIISKDITRKPKVLSTGRTGWDGQDGHIRTDSGETICPLTENGGGIINSLKVQLDWVPSHVGIPGNEAADVGAKKVMTIGTPDPTLPAKAEIYTVIKNAIIPKWQAQWNITNKRPTGHGSLT